MTCEIVSFLIGLGIAAIGGVICVIIRIKQMIDEKKENENESRN